MADNLRPLTAKQQAFVAEYLKDLNATQAAIRAGYAPGKTATVQGARLLVNANIAAAIAEKQDERAKKAGIDAERVLLEVARMALSDPRGIVGEDGEVIPLHQLPDDVAAAVSSVEFKNGTVRYRFWDKNAAAEKLMKHLGLFERDNRQKGDEFGRLLAFLDERQSRFRTRR